MVILSSSMYEKIYLKGLLEGVKLFKFIASSGIHTIIGRLDLLFNTL